MGPDKPVLYVSDVCELLTLKPRTLRRLIERGHFPRGRKIGGRIGWTGAEYAAYLVLAGRWHPGPAAEMGEGTQEKPRKKAAGPES